MERKAYSVDEKLFNLLLEENFDKLNIGELQKLFDNLPYEISDKWVFISDKPERVYQKESENFEMSHFFSYSRLSGYKYFSLIDYENSSTYKIGIPDVSESNDAMDRQKSVTVYKTNTNSEDIIEIQKYVFDRLTNQTQINNYLVNNMKQVLIKFFTDFFPYEFGRIQNRVKQNNSPTEHKNPFFVTYNVDLKQFQEHKNVVAEKLHTLKDIMDINIKEVFFRPYKNEDIISLINMEIRTMYCHRKFGPLPKTRLWYNIHLLERSIRWQNENEETSRPSLKPKLFLRHSAVKVHKQKCVGDTISAMNNFQSGSDSFLKMRRPSLNPLINTLMPMRSGLPNLSNLLDG